MLINNYTFWEDAGEVKSPKYQFALDDSRVIRSLQLRSPDEIDRVNAMAQLLGFQTFMSPSQTLRYISRLPPHSYAAGSNTVNPAGLPYLYATSVPSLRPLPGWGELAFPRGPP